MAPVSQKGNNGTSPASAAGVVYIPVLAAWPYQGGRKALACHTSNSSPGAGAGLPKTILAGTAQSKDDSLESQLTAAPLTGKEKPCLLCFPRVPRAPELEEGRGLRKEERKKHILKPQVFEPWLLQERKSGPAGYVSRL